MDPRTHDLRQDRDRLAAAVDRQTSLHVRYSAGEMVCQTDSYVAGVHIIHCGAVSDRVVHPGSKACPSCILGPGDLLGMEVLLARGGTVASSQLRALTDTELHFLQAEEFRRMLAEDAVLAHEVIGCIASQYFRMQQVMLHAGSDEAALGHLLVQLAWACGCIMDDQRVILPHQIDRALLCELAGLTPRRLRRVLSAIPSLTLAPSRIAFNMHDVVSTRRSCDPRVSPP